MEDDVSSILENMKLTTDEEEVIPISDEGRIAEIESCSQSLLGKFLTCRSFNKRAAQGTIKRAWGLENRVQVVEVGANLFQFKFNSEFDMNRVLKGGPWTFDNQVLLLVRWKPGMTAANVRFETASLWVQIWGAPFDMASPSVAEAVGGRLGVVEDVEKRRQQDIPNFFMRVKVALPISKPLRRGAFLADSNGQKYWVNFKYERLALFCHYCGLLGHDLRHCAQHFGATKNGEEADCQYGDWMKAIGSRARSPNSRGRYRDEPERATESESVSSQQGSGQARDEDDGGGGGAGGRVRMTQLDAGLAGKHGILPESLLPNSVIHGEKLTEIMELEGIVGPTYGGDDQSPSQKGLGDFFGPTTKLDIKGLMDQVDAQGNRQQIKASGPQRMEKQSRWTRLTRMELGPVDLFKEGAKTILGKRGSQGMQLDMHDKSDERAEKKVKGWDDSEIIEAAGVLQHPCREQ